MKTLLGTEIPANVRGIVYLCKFDHKELTITVISEIMCQSPFYALEVYANIPNPESQLATGGTHEEMCEKLEKLHKRMKDKIWLKDLSECL